MNSKLKRWIQKFSKTRGNLRLVLLGLGEYADDDCTCWPPVSAIAEYAGTSERVARNLLHKAEEQGFITISPQAIDFGQGWQADQYHFAPSIVDAVKELPVEVHNTGSKVSRSPTIHQRVLGVLGNDKLKKSGANGAVFAMTGTEAFVASFTYNGTALLFDAPWLPDNTRPFMPTPNEKAQAQTQTVEVNAKPIAATVAVDVTVDPEADAEAVLVWCQSSDFWREKATSLEKIRRWLDNPMSGLYRQWSDEKRRQAALSAVEANKENEKATRRAKVLEEDRERIRKQKERDAQAVSPQELKAALNRMKPRQTEEQKVSALEQPVVADPTPTPKKPVVAENLVTVDVVGMIRGAFQRMDANRRIPAERPTSWSDDAQERARILERELAALGESALDAPPIYETADEIEDGDDLAALWDEPPRRAVGWEDYR